MGNEIKNDYPWKRRQRRMLRVVCLVGLVIVLPLSYTLFVRSSLHRELAKIRAAGEPATFAEVVQYATAAPAELERALEYQKAFNVHPIQADRDAIVAVEDQLRAAPRHGRFSDALLSSMREQLETDSESLRLLHAAFQGPPARFPICLENQWDFSYLPQLREAVQRLQWEANLAAHEARSQEAVDSLLGIFILADTLAKEPVLFCQMERISHQTTAVTALCRALEIAAFQDAQLRQLYEEIRKGDVPEALGRAFAGERALQLENYDVSNKKPMPEDPWHNGQWVVLWFVHRLGWLSNEPINYARVMSRVIAASHRPPHECLQALKALEKEMGSRDGNPPIRMWGSIIGTVKVFARGEAVLRTAYTAMAVERYCVKYARLPAQLDELVPEFLDVIPLDPFNGQALRYTPRGKGYVVYSLGENGKDENGDDSANKKNLDDICFRIER